VFPVLSTPTIVLSARRCYNDSW